MITILSPTDDATLPALLVKRSAWNRRESTESILEVACENYWQWISGMQLIIRLTSQANSCLPQPERYPFEGCC